MADAAGSAVKMRPREVLSDRAAQKSGDFSITPAPFRSRFVLRGGAAVAKATGTAFGVDIPVQPLATRSCGPHAALWLGPDEWLLLTETDEAASLGARIEGALASLPHSLVDVSHRQTGFALSGRLAARVLSAGCPLDLRDRAFPPGLAARTLFMKSEIVLWRRSDAAWHVEVWRSFAPYLAAQLAVALDGASGL